uniref:Uncharacterized protein n=1 Tax=Anguilla anguilla TaxID=7936 RepID=A0A0E9PSB1_ANGAN
MMQAGNTNTIASPVRLEGLSL